VIAPALGQRTPITKMVPAYSSMPGSRRTRPVRPACCCACRIPGTGACGFAGRRALAANSTRFRVEYYVVQEGYAYASQNKGVLNLKLTHVGRSSGLPLNPASGRLRALLRQRPGTAVHPLAPLLIAAANWARQGVRPLRESASLHLCGRYVERRYQVRRAIETAAELFDGAWTGRVPSSMPAGPIC